MNSKTCSVIVPIYNAEPYLAQCLSSIKMQTYIDLQVILVNDGSTDNSAAIAQSFVDADKRFTMYQQTNQGQGVARNRGLEIAIGEYIVFVDADDYIDVDFIEKHVSMIGQADYVQSGYRRVSTDGEILDKKLPVHCYQFTSACMRLYRREYILALRFEKGYYEDVIWTLDILHQKPNVKLLKYIGYNYRLNPHSTTSVQHHCDQVHVSCLIRQRPLTCITLYTYIKLKLHWLFKL